uniref:PIFI-like Ig-like domain-containing protein n=1 Tax=Picocystis salinarum TaxID=88271 RepID=A0A7S3XCM1_9CHLO|mmetsp:Transcript_10813/g.66785  ORF Transcript_10813/g.66785 Transcript_10813/m.66785 type:complete len:206 (+) Transcript_10813:522-1139(+)
MRRTHVPRGSVPEATDWSTFEMGKSPVYWDAKPTAGELLTIYFNPKVNNVLEGDSIAFNGGFNGPFMCGGAPRPMTKKDRGPACDPLYSIRINVPKHAVWLEFSFTDGQEWDEGYKLKFLVPANHRGQSLEFFNKELAKEMSEEDACYHAIFPDPVSEPDSLFLGGSMSIGMSCDLDVVPGCRDPDSPNYDPFATIDDDTCEEEF